MVLHIGDKAPDFSLPNEQNQQIKLSDFLGKKVIVYFYPKDYTEGCTEEACDFRDSHIAFTEKGAVILGISRDNAQRHQAFKQQYTLPFILLTDTNSKVCIAYGVVKKRSLLRPFYIGVSRSTFLVDEKGYIRAIWRDVKAKGHVAQVLHEV